MPNSCCVPGCNTNYGSNNLNRNTVFSFPKDTDLKLKWMEKLNLNFEPTFYNKVCINHFLDEFLIRSDYFDFGNGETFNIKRKRTRLKAGAFPSILPDPRLIDGESLCMKIRKSKLKEFELLNSLTKPELVLKDLKPISKTVLDVSKELDVKNVDEKALIQEKKKYLSKSEQNYCNIGPIADVSMSSSSSPPNREPEYNCIDINESNKYNKDRCEGYEAYQNVVYAGLNTSTLNAIDPLINSSSNSPNAVPIDSEPIEERKHLNVQLENDRTHAETKSCTPNEGNKKDAHACYAEYVAAQLRKISNIKTLAFVRQKINDVFFQLEMGTLYEGQSQSTSQSPNIMPSISYSTHSSLCARPTVVSRKEPDSDELDIKYAVNILNPSIFFLDSPTKEADCDIVIKQENLN